MALASSAATQLRVGGALRLEGPAAWGGLQWGTVAAMAVLLLVVCIVIARIARPREESEHPDDLN